MKAHVERPWLWLLVAIGFVTGVALVTETVNANLTTDLTASGGTFWDFRDAGYFPARAVLDGVVPYDVGRYFAAYPVAQEFPLLPPIYIVVHAPFQLLSAHGASVLMYGLNLLGIIALSAWSLKLSRYRVAPLAVLGVSTLMVISNGGRNILHSGQASLLFAAGAYLALTASTDPLGASGVFTTLVKPGIGLPFTLLLAAAGKVRRALLGAVTAGIVSLVLMIPFVVWAGGIGPLVEILRDNVAFSAESLWVSLETTTARVDAAATLAMITGWTPPRVVEFALIAAVVGGSGTVLFIRRRTLQRGLYWDAAIVLICLGTITSIYHSFYDLGLLLLPTILLSRRDFAKGSTSQALRIATLVAILVASFNPFRVDRVIQFLADSPRSVEVLSPGLTGLSMLVALVLTCWMILRMPLQVGIEKADGEGKETGHFATAESGQDSAQRILYDD